METEIQGGLSLITLVISLNINSLRNSSIKTFWKPMTAAKQMEMCHCQSNILEAQMDLLEP